MAKKLPGLQRVLDVPSLAAVAYGEIASSLYFALGVIALYALGFTPWVLLAVGLLFLVVALSYAEGTTAIPEPGGAATFVRRAFNDPAGFLTGWALILDYLIVMALAGLFVPHYLGHAIGWEGLTDEPWDTVVGVLVILTVGALRLAPPHEPLPHGDPGRRASRSPRTCCSSASGSPSSSRRMRCPSASTSEPRPPGATSRSRCRSRCSRTPASRRWPTSRRRRASPGRTLPRSLFVGIGLVVAVSVAIGLVGISAFPGGTGLGTEWLRAPLMGITAALDAELPAALGDAVRIMVGLTGVLVLLVAVTTSISGAGRLAYSMGQRQMLPHAFGKLNRRTLIAPVSIVSSTLIAATLLVIGHFIPTEAVRFLAGLFSFGVLLAFTAAQLAVIRLRFTEPDLDRPFRAPGNVRIRGADVPIAALVGAPLTFAIWIFSMATHDATRIAGPAWLLVGALVYVGTRWSRHKTILGRVLPADPDLVPEVEGVYERILVPMKLGLIGEEVLATAIRLAEERGAALYAIHVVWVPMDKPIDAPMHDAEERAEASLAEAKLLASEHDVEVETEVVRSRAIGEAIVERATTHAVDLIVMGSAPRWRRQSRFFSPTVDYVLRHAPCEVMVIAYPQGVLEEEEAGALLG